jgi:sugar lactone lactonase YvrE
LDVRLRSIPIISIALFCSTLLTAEGTRTWEQSKFDDLSKGTAKGVAIRSTGGMELAPAFAPLTTTPSIYIWAIAIDQGGSLYVAAGSPASVYRISRDGKSETIFQPKELQVQALVVDKSGAVYAATNPDGKIYRIEHRAGAATDPKSAAASGWSSSVYFDPGTKYIWDLALDNAGNLFVATGDHGEIFRVTPKGDHSVFFKSDETHIRVLAFDSQGNLIAGSDGSGLVYRITPGGEGFVLYSAPKKEITALAIDKAGNIYAAGAGEKHSNGPPINFPSINFSNPSPAPAAGQQSGITITNAAPNAPLFMGGFPGLGMNAAGGSEIYRIAPDGSPSRLWSSHEDLVYALVFDPQGHLLAGTGNRGHVFAINGEDEYADLVKASAAQVTAFADSSDGGIYAATSNLGKVFHLGTKEAEGSYESDVFDAHVFSRWGRAEFRGVGNVELYARSGNVDNPDRNWSSWKKVDLQKDAAISVPAARFIQWKAVLHTGEPAPRLDSITLNYLPKNVAPDFDDVTVQAATRYQPGPKPMGSDTSGSSGSPQQPHFDSPPPAIHDRDSIGVKWTVHDDNDDQMVYSVYYKGDGETRWLLLKDNLTDKFYSFDASLLPDGGYTIEVLASDAPSHSPGQGLTAVKDSARFEVDTTAPQVVDLHALAEGSQIHVSFRAVDSFSAIKRAEYSVDAGDWQFIEPVDQLSDSRTENYDFRVAAPPVSKDASNPTAGSLEHVVVVRAYDRYDNMSSAKTVIRGK